MDETTRLRMRRAHANHANYCTCGKVVHGNGGIYNHKAMHERAGDGHRYILRRQFIELFPDWTPHDNKRRIMGPRP